MGVSVHLLVPALRKKHPLRWETLTREQKEQLLAACQGDDDKSLRQAWATLKKPRSVATMAA